VLDDQVRTADRKAVEAPAACSIAALHIVEMVCSVGGRRMHLWRAVHDEGEVLDLVVQPRRDTEPAQKLLRWLLHNQPVEPQTITADGLTSSGAALDRLDPRHLHRPGRLRENNWAPTCRSNDENDSSSSSSPTPQPRDSSPHMRRSTTPPTSSAI
jgi:transposase-like protein